MAEYIKREDALKIMRRTSGDYATAFAEMRKLSAADVAPVRRGHWEWLGPNSLVAGCMCGTCSACKIRSKYITNTMVCPNCGATMDLGDKEETT